MANPALLIAAAVAIFALSRKGGGYGGSSEGDSEGEGGGAGGEGDEGGGEIVGETAATAQDGGAMLVLCNEDLPYLVTIFNFPAQGGEPEHGHDALDSEPSKRESGFGGAIGRRVGQIEVDPSELKNMIEFEWDTGEGGYADHRHTISLTGAQIGTLIKTGALEGVKTDSGWYYEGSPGGTQEKKSLTHRHNVTLICQRGTGTVLGGSK